MTNNELQQWEYFTDLFPDRGGDAEEFLNGYGERGWELIFAFPYNDGHKYIFKRPKTQPQ